MNLGNTDSKSGVDIGNCSNSFCFMACYKPYSRRNIPDSLVYDFYFRLV